jgi:hypothetical protein
MPLTLVRLRTPSNITLKISKESERKKQAKALTATTIFALILKRACP